MKRIEMKYIVILTAIVSTLLTGCSEDFLLLENPNNVDSKNYYQTEEDLISAVTAAYSDLQRFPQIFNLYLSEGRSNNIFAGLDNAQRDLVDISHFRTTPDTGTLDNAWKIAYALIGKANKTLEVIEELDLDDEAFNLQAEAEMKFLRGYTYYCLTRVFGKIPLITSVTSPEASLEIGQSELPEVYEQIVADLQFATANLPESYPVEEEGHATKMAAKSMLAEVYLTWSGFPVENSAKLTDAITTLEEILAVEGGQFQWPTDYSVLFKAASDNQFSLFEVQYLSGPAGIGATFPSEFLTNNMKDFPFNGGVPMIRPSEDLVALFDVDNDLRFTSSIDTTYVNNFWMTIETDYIKKWFETGLSLLSRSDWPQNYPIMRPSNVFLMHAEALNRRDASPSATAIESLNRPRRRAGLADLNPTTKEEFQTALKDEYRREFVAEGIYWHYLVRSGTAVEVMNDWMETTSQDTRIDEHHLIYPIPFTQLFIKPGLYVQNPGY